MSPATVVAGSGEGLQLVHFDVGKRRVTQFRQSTSSEEQEVCEQGADGEGGGVGETGGSRRALFVSPAAMVVVSGQGMQIVPLGAF